MSLSPSSSPTADTPYSSSRSSFTSKDGDAIAAFARSSIFSASDDFWNQLTKLSLRSNRGRKEVKRSNSLGWDESYWQGEHLSVPQTPTTWTDTYPFDTDVCESPDSESPTPAGPRIVITPSFINNTSSNADNTPTPKWIARGRAREPKGLHERNMSIDEDQSDAFRNPLPSITIEYASEGVTYETHYRVRNARRN